MCRERIRMATLDSQLQDKLIGFATALIDQQCARVIVPPSQPASGYWFGGGNVIEDSDGSLLVVGRYRDAGDSRTGLQAGRRGWELAVFRSADRGSTFEKVLGFDKSDLTVDGKEVLSIEGSAIRRVDGGYELFVSTEKSGIGYPAGFEDHLKPGTGVWSIERLCADSIEGLRDSPRETVVSSADPRFVHVKDPFLYETAAGDLVLLFCSHPYCWTSSNTGFAIRRRGEKTFDEPVFEFFPRGHTWDVAMTRGTCVVDVPQVGTFRDRSVSLVFYDGGECIRNHEEHATAVTRSRGYSCEELGGAAFALDGDLSKIERLSRYRPLFVSPHGTGCSRYVDVLGTSEGFFATWQQSQADGSQPLVANFLSNADAHNLLT